MKHKTFFPAAALFTAVMLYCQFQTFNAYAQNYQWARNIGSINDDIGRSITVDGVGNVYIAGYFNGTADFDPSAGIANLTSLGGFDIFLSKYNSSGNYLWAKSIGSAIDDACISIAVDSSGNVYITGYFNDTADFDPGVGIQNLISNGSFDIFFAKYDANGNYLWAKNIGSTAKEESNSIALDAAGNVYITGYFQGIADFDPGTGTQNLTSIGLEDIFFAKYDANGNYLWAKSIGSVGGTDIGFGIVTNASGNVYVTGYFQGTADFDPGAGTQNLTPVGNYDIFFSKYDANGNYLWAKNIGSTLNDNCYSIAIDVSGNVHITGNFAGTTDFDPGVGTQNLTPVGGNDIFFAKYDTNGNYFMAKNIGSTVDDYGRSIVTDALGNIYVTGYFTGTTDFDPGVGTQNLTPVGSTDIFFAKYDANGNYLWANRIGDALTDMGLSMATHATGNVYVTGYFGATADFDPGAGTQNLTSVGSYDVFFAKYDQCNITTTTTSINVNCFGSCSGSINLTPSGGTLPYTYIWSNAATTEDISNLCAGVYTITITDANGCKQNTNATITQPAAALSAGIFSTTNVNCNGNCNGSIDLAPAGGSIPYTFNWSNGATTEDLTNVCAGTYFLTLKDANACPYVSLSTSITEPSPLTVSLSNNNPSCGNTNGSVTANVTGGTGAYIYSWSSGETISVISGKPSGNYSVNVFDAAGCIASNSTSLNDNSNYPTEFNTTVDNACPGELVEFDLYANTSVNSYNWNFGDGQTSTSENDVSHSYTNAGTYTVRLIINTSSCGDDTLYKQIVVSNTAIPDAQFDIDYNPSCPGDAVEFHPRNYRAQTYLWDFGDGQTSASSDNVTHPYTAPGNYTVALTITNICGGSSTFKDTLEIKNNVNIPTWIRIKTNNNSVMCPNEYIRFETSYNALSYKWHFGNGDSSVFPAPFYKYVTTGTYNVTLKVTNGCGKDTTISTNITIDPNLPFNASDFGLFKDTLCPGDIVYINKPYALSYNWNFGDGYTTSINDPVHSYASVGTYNFSVKMTNGCGKDTTLFRTMVVKNGLAPKFDSEFFGVAGNGGCVGDSVLFYSFLGYSYKWEFGDGSFTTTTKQFAIHDKDGTFNVDVAKHAYNATGTYKVYITYFNGCGNSVKDSTTVTIGNNLPVNGEIVGLDETVFRTCEKIQFLALGGNNFVWNFGDGNTYTSGSGSVKHSYDLAGTYTPSVTITNACGNTATYTTYVTVGGAANSFNTSTTQIDAFCSNANGSATVAVSGGVGPYTYSWSNGSTAQTVSSILPGTYQIVVKDSNGCESSQNVTINNQTNTLVLFPSKTDANCGTADGTAKVSAANGNPPYSYLWSNGQTTQSIAGLFAGTYNIKVTDSKGCYVNTNVFINNTSGPTLSFVYSQPTCYGMCNGSINMTITGAGLPFTMLWSNGAASKDISNICAGTYKVSVTDKNGCVAINTVTLGSAAPVYVNYTYVADTGGTNAVSFTDASQSNVVKGFWDFGDGSTSLLQNPNHIFPAAGAYNVCLTVQDSSGCSNSKCGLVFAGDTSAIAFCLAKFTPDSLSTYTRAFYDSSQGSVTTWKWNFGDNTISTLKNPTHTYTQGGFYNVCLTTYDTVSQCMSTYCKLIEITDPDTIICYAEFNFIPDTGNTVNFTNLSQGTFTSISWDFGDGGTSSEFSPSYQYPQSGYYNVCLTVFDSVSACMSSLCKNIKIGDDTTVCYTLANFVFFVDTGNTVYFSNNSYGYSNVHWSFGDGTFSNNSSPVLIHNYGAEGFYDVCLTAFNLTTGCIDDHCVTIQIGGDSTGVNDCEADFDFMLLPNQNKMVKFNHLAQGQYTSLYWEFGDGDNSNQPNPVHNYNSVGFFDVCLTVFNAADSCINTHCEVVQVIDTVAVVSCNSFFTYIVDSATKKVTFNDASLGTPDFWYWNFGDFSIANNQQDPVYTYAQPGYYEVCLTIYKGSDCQNTYCKVISVGDVSNSVFANFTYFTDSVTSTAYFSNQSLGNITQYNWDFGDGQFSIYKNPAHTYPLTDGWYLACLTVKNANNIQDMACKNINIYNTLEDPCLSSCVWPGDANSSLESNHYDLMSIGLNHGETGPVRDSVSTRWIGHHADNWASVQINGVNNKHSDCNGDGVINVLDILAIKDNFAYSHPYQPGKTSNPANPDLYFEIITPNVAPGVEVEVKIMAGKDSVNLYGLAYEVDMDLNQVQNKNVATQYDSSWIGGTGINMLSFDRTDSANNRVTSSLARNDQTDKNGFGEISRLKFTIDPATTSNTFIMCVKTDYGVNTQGDSVLFNSTCDTILLTGIPVISKTKQIMIYPNPTKGIVNYDLPQTSEGFTVTIINFLSQKVYEKSEKDGGKKTINIENLPSGIYLISITGKDSVYRQKLQVVK